MAQVNPRTFADAKQLGDSVYELILTNWGNRGLAQDPNNGSIQYPPVKNLPGTATAFLPEGAIPIVSDFLLPPIPSLSAIAIAPRSDVDMCIIHYPSLPQLPAAQTPNTNGGVFDPGTEHSISIEQGFVNYGGVIETEQYLAVDSPLIAPQPGPILIRASQHSWFGDSYTPTDPAGMQTYGTALNSLPNSLGPGFFKVPELRLLLFLNSKGVLPPTKRAPFYVSTSIFGFYPLAGAIPPQVYPVMGRKRLRFGATNTSGVPITFRVEGVFPRFSPSFGSSIFQFSEAVLLASDVVPADGTLTLEVTNPGFPFITLTGTGGGLSSLDVFFSAFD